MIYMLSADIHLHTYYSDGSLSPADVVRLANQKKIKTISITDHDSISGLDEAKKEAKKHNISFINGIEIMASRTEILGYLFDKKSKALQEIISHNLSIREDTILQKIEKLKDLDIDVDLKEVYTLAGPDKLIMQTHLARILVEKKYVKNIQEAFNKYFKYIKINKTLKNISDKRAIKVIKSAGGVAVMPHPWWLKNYLKENFENFVIELIGYGLDGIETTGPHLNEHNDFLKTVKNVCKKYNLIQTGGSDFHSLDFLLDNKIGEFNIDSEIIRKLRERSKF